MLTSKPMLSARQAELVKLIDTLTAEKGYPPTLRECAAIMGVHFTRVYRIAETAEIRGAMTHTPGIARSWRVVETRAADKKKATR